MHSHTAGLGKAVLALAVVLDIPEDFVTLLGSMQGHAIGFGSGQDLLSTTLLVRMNAHLLLTLASIWSEHSVNRTRLMYRLSLLGGSPLGCARQKNSHFKVPLRIGFQLRSPLGVQIAGCAPMAEAYAARQTVVVLRCRIS
ncbi:MAG: hypothetical protein ACI841_002866 [Planctomycetota bacterium]